MLKYYKQLLTYITRDTEKSINSILDYASSADDSEFTERLYQTTLGALAETKNEVRVPASSKGHII